jgi:hypothetical protein
MQEKIMTSSYKWRMDSITLPLRFLQLGTIENDKPFVFVAMDISVSCSCLYVKERFWRAASHSLHQYCKSTIAHVEHSLIIFHIDSEGSWDSTLAKSDMRQGQRVANGTMCHRQ